MTRPSQNSQAGLRSCIRVVHPVDVAALVCSPNEARSFARPLTISSLGVRTTVHPGPSNSVGVMPTAFLRTLQCQPQNDLRRHSAARIEKIETRATEVSLDTLIKVSEATAEGKALAARIFQLNFDTQAELHALLIRATKLAGGTP